MQVRDGPGSRDGAVSTLTGGGGRMPAARRGAARPRPLYANAADNSVQISGYLYGICPFVQASVSMFSVHVHSV